MRVPILGQSLKATGDDECEQGGEEPVNIVLRRGYLRTCIGTLRRATAAYRENPKGINARNGDAKRSLCDYQQPAHPRKRVEIQHCRSFQKARFRKQLMGTSSLQT